MSVAGSRPTVSEAVIKYSARTKLADLANEIAASQKFSKVTSKILQATKIRLWLKALDYSDFLTKEQREKIWWCLIDVAEINDFGIAPLLEGSTQPSVLAGSTVTTYVTNNYLGGEDFQNTDVDTGTEIIDSFSITLGTAVRWDYCISNSSNQRAGSFITTWTSDGGFISDGADLSSPDIGDTSDVTLSCDISAGLVRLKATSLSDNWIISGKRYLINSTSSASGNNLQNLIAEIAGKWDLTTGGVLRANNTLSGDYDVNFTGSGNLTVAGKIGIGTTTPSEKLEVVGNVLISNNSTVGGQLDVTDTIVSQSTLECSGIRTNTSGAFLKTSVLDIGDWNMNITPNIIVSHGVTDYRKIRTITVFIRDDADTYLASLTDAPFSGGLQAQKAGYIGQINSTDIQLYRLTGGAFDNTFYDSTGFNRGWITITYES